jgi:hypothetical protein
MQRFNALSREHLDVLSAATFAAFCVLAVACSGKHSGVKGDATLTDVNVNRYGYVAPKPVGSYPSKPPTIQRWIDAGDSVAIRAHAWDIWASVTANATADSQPTWQTWFSGQEVFSPSARPTAEARTRNARLPLERPRQSVHRIRQMQRLAAGGIPFDSTERVFAFNRFTAPTANYIWNHRLNDIKTIADTSAAFIKANTPIANRAVLTSVDSVDANSIVIKCVFQFISDSTITAIPFWMGDGSRYSTDSLHPPPRMWKQAVAVDPSNLLKGVDSVFMKFNTQPARWLKVVPLSAFYHVRLTAADSATLTDFGAENGDDLGFNSDTSEAMVRAAARPGNYGLLMAMHVTGKEIVNWTWQSFWWSPNPQDRQFGADRPKFIGAPWNNYNMTVAYSMMTPKQAPNIAFNPYLETSLSGTVPLRGGDSLAWTGISTNCMSCHRRAARGIYPDSFIVPLYGPAANVNAGDATIFNVRLGAGTQRIPTVKTDFLWSVAIRSTAPASMKVMKPSRSAAVPATVSHSR